MDTFICNCLCVIGGIVFYAGKNFGCLVWKNYTIFIIVIIINYNNNLWCVATRIAPKAQKQNWKKHKNIKRVRMPQIEKKTENTKKRKTIFQITQYNNSISDNTLEKQI